MMSFNNKVYDVLKWVATLLLPAMGTLYFSLASIWGLPYAEQVVGTITAIDTLLGILLGISTANYKGDGTLTLSTDSSCTDIMEAVIDTPLDELAGKKTATLTIEVAEVLSDDI